MGSPRPRNPKYVTVCLLSLIVDIFFFQLKWCRPLSVAVVAVAVAGGGGCGVGERREGTQNNHMTHDVISPPSNGDFDFLPRKFLFWTGLEFLLPLG